MLNIEETLHNFVVQNYTLRVQKQFSIVIAIECRNNVGGTGC
ncbi:MAG: hypothetical protein EMLJLAPB_00275 [Candidatus Argoarchaeum ethanivorans]|uniref:Uncharacterized protein n=1 Tax=Candidatus Argoarchaeum ethanivorans TaxID=2608793 RepID=A0A811T1J0_9EURY|nr:MAG: hypothetical protein FFODKBPE_00044 [Candidatus Argoarchaeum ethanivorans]CAD6492428.1 MAG: hypothetical protein EMLJLAPB_00275 [Candidatus Argoarchaeum ethanivorans]